LSSLGVRYACISPGSRNTPLTFAFAKNKKFKIYTHIDERSSAFFALGLAKAQNEPVAIVCTSGTATAEFYPAIIEAFKQRAPLIVCTADRPAELLLLGANQTIFQDNMYKNHIRYFADAGLPDISKDGLKGISEIAFSAYWKCFVEDCGPAHINFPFKKPFEPDSYTDEAEQSVIELSKPSLSYKLNTFFNKDIEKEKWFSEVFGLIKTSRKGLIIAGPCNFEKPFYNACVKLAESLGFPIIADASSGFRFGTHSKKNVISNFDAILRSDNFTDSHFPDLILHFGRTVTSKYLEEFLSLCRAPRYMINEYGDWFDPSNKSIGAFACSPALFCGKISENLSPADLEGKTNQWLNDFIWADSEAEKLKRKFIDGAPFPSESGLINRLIELLPDGSNLMLSNSMPIRDFDNFASVNGKKINLYFNRGASGIDGIISTALGIAAGSKKTTALLTGDLAFYYDLTSLLTAQKYKLPVIVILVNNNGGGIFDILPVSKYGKIFREHFTVPHDLNFAPLVKGFGGNHHNIKPAKSLTEKFRKAVAEKNFTALEVKTDTLSSLKYRKKFWAAVKEKLAKGE
jgi:2-succinyl-5-enolpyruvyl-6-hydroxy-3-cyclohexene-1-carboxylate synthase